MEDAVDRVNKEEGQGSHMAGARAMAESSDGTKKTLPCPLAKRRRGNSDTQSPTLDTL